MHFLVKLKIKIVLITSIFKTADNPAISNMQSYPFEPEELFLGMIIPISCFTDLLCPFLTHRIARENSPAHDII